MMILENITVFETYPEKITASATLILAIGTIILAIGTLLLARYTYKLWLAQDKPCLIFECKEKEVKVMDEQNPYELYIKNIGKGSAFKIRFEVYPAYSRNIKAGKFSIDFLSSGEPKFLCELKTIDFESSAITYIDINGKGTKQKPYSTSW